jgi:hypothetical protein
MWIVRKATQPSKWIVAVAREPTSESCFIGNDLVILLLMNRILKRIGKTSLAALGRVISGFDRAYLGDDIPDNARSSWEAYLSEIQPGLRILEIGSREVIGPSSVRHLFGGSEYVGFDYYPGSNVDVAGDVHQLSSYFSPDEKFDLIFSLACFEHFAMPWIVAPKSPRCSKLAESSMLQPTFRMPPMSGHGTFFSSAIWVCESYFPNAWDLNV